MTRLPAAWRFLLVLCVPGLAACHRVAALPDPPVRLPGTFSAGGKVEAPDRWWTAFGDARLNELVDGVLDSNLDLLTAWDRLRQAEALARQAAAGLWPWLDATAAAGRTRSRTPTTGTTSTSDFSLGLRASYEVDLWSRVRASRDAARLAARASREDVATTAIALSAQTAITWLRLLETVGQLEILDAQLRTNQDYLDLVTARFERGQVSAVDVLQQQELVEASRSEKHLMEARARVLANQLAVLLGRPPAEVAIPSDWRLPDLPPLPATGLPAELVGRRPDVRAARLRLESANRGVAAAIAERFPALTLTGLAETSAGHLEDLFESWVASVAGSILAPVLDGGRRAAEVERTRAVVAQRFHEYAQAILRALREVEDALVRERHQQLHLTSVEKQLDFAARAAAQSRERYVKGAEDYLRVLTTLRDLQRLQRRLLEARRELLEDRVALYQALAGGFPLTVPPAPGQGDDRDARR